MSDKELEEYINKIEPNFNSHLEKGTIEMSNEYYNLLEEKMVRLINKNQELNKKYVNAVADYETTMFEKEQLNKQLEEKNKPQIFIDTQNIEERYAEGLYQDYLEEENKKYKDQQKEFINYLENEKDRLARECSQIYEDSLGKTRLVNEDIFNEVNDILQKYKIIIGDIDDKK